MNIREIKCKSILNKSKLGGYTINPYIGCSHNCVYCYANHFWQNIGIERKENEIEVKINSPDVLLSQLRRSKKDDVFISSITDPYQPIEEKYKITRKILFWLSKFNFPTSILTKSKLILRDMDIIKSFNCEVGFTIMCNESWRKYLEPNASKIEERIYCLEKFSTLGIKTFIFIGPIIPGITDELIENFPEIKVNKIIVDKLNFHGNGHIKKMKDFAEKFGIDFKKFFDKKYYEMMKVKISSIAKERDIECEFCY
jgi:DNA repair photolyase